MCNLSISSKPGVRRLQQNCLLFWESFGIQTPNALEPRAVTPKFSNILLPTPIVPDLINKEDQNTFPGLSKKFTDSNPKSPKISSIFHIQQLRFMELCIIKRIISVGLLEG